MMQRAYARLHQHDVRAKQTKVCDAERTGFPTPAYASNYLQTDGQTSLTAVSRPSMILQLGENFTELFFLNKAHFSKNILHITIANIKK